MKYRTPLRTAAILAILAVALTLLPGCNTTPADRVQALKAAVDQGQALSEKLDEQLAVILPMIDEARTLLDSVGLDEDTRSGIQADLDGFLAKAAALRAMKAQADTKVAKFRELVDKAAADPDFDLAAELELWGQGVSEISPLLPQPYGGWVALAGLMLTTIGGIVATLREAQKRKAAEGTTVDLVRSVDAALSHLDAESADEIKSTLKTSQSTQTQAQVRQIKAPK